MSVLLPVLWPLAVGGLLLVLWRHGVWQRRLSVIGAGGHVACAALLVSQVVREGRLVLELGDWPAPMGIVFVADRLGAVMALVAAVVGLVVALASLEGIDARREAFGYHALVHLLLAGVCGAFLTGDFFNLFVWFEVMLMASFVLLSLGGERKQLGASLVYVSLNLVASTVFLAGLGLLYGLVGTVNMADVALRLPQVPNSGIVAMICALLAIAFMAKAAVFPLYVWLPASYHTPPTVVTALFAGLLTKVGVVALFRTTTLVFAPAAPFLLDVLLVVALLTMVLGVLGAVAQTGFRRVLAFHVVSQIGYMVLGLAFLTPAGIAAAFLYLVHNILAKMNLFLIGGVAARLCGSERLERMGGLYRRRPWLALLFLVSALALAGLPPLSGFWAKLFVVQAGLESSAWLSVAAALGVGMLTLFSMLKLWNEAFWKAQPPEHLVDDPRPQPWSLVPIVGVGAGLVAFGVMAGPLYGFALDLAHELLDREGYIEAVLGVWR